jgi:hypothetical protein
MGSNIRLLDVFLSESFRHTIKRPAWGLGQSQLLRLHRITQNVDIQTPPDRIRIYVSSGYTRSHLKISARDILMYSNTFRNRVSYDIYSLKKHLYMLTPCGQVLFHWRNNASGVILATFLKSILAYIDQPLWSSGQSSWLQIQRSRVRFLAPQFFWEAVDMERGPFILVSITEELLERKTNGSESRKSRSFALTTRHHQSTRVATNFTDMRPLGRYSSLAD